MPFFFSFFLKKRAAAGASVGGRGIREERGQADGTGGGGESPRTQKKNLGSKTKKYKT